MGDNDELMQKFRAAAMKFIEVVDTAPHVEANAFLANVSRSMAELYSIALSLPAVEPDTTSTDAPPFRQTNGTRYVALSKKRLVPSTPTGKSSTPLARKNQCKGVSWETSRKFISTLNTALN